GISVSSSSSSTLSSAGSSRCFSEASSRLSATRRLSPLTAPSLAPLVPIIFSKGSATWLNITNSPESSLWNLIITLVFSLWFFLHPRVVSTSCGLLPNQEGAKGDLLHLSRAERGVRVKKIIVTVTTIYFQKHPGGRIIPSVHYYQPKGVQPSVSHQYRSQAVQNHCVSQRFFHRNHRCQPAWPMVCSVLLSGRLHFRLSNRARRPR